MKDLPNIQLIPPQSYFACAKLVKNAQIILTDSGGMQEESNLLQKPLIIFRSKTEREISRSHTLLSMDVELIDQALNSFYNFGNDRRKDTSIFEKKLSPSTFVESAIMGVFPCMI